MKICGKCGIEKNDTDFHKYSGNKSGHLQSNCKKCCKEYYKEYREKNKEHINELNERNKERNKVRKRIILKHESLEERKTYILFMKNVYKIDLRRTSTNKLDLIEKCCPYCQSRKTESNHHLIPRKYGGGNNKENMISLCDTYHDYIEIKTEDWINSGKSYDMDLFRAMIIHLGFE